MIRPIASTRIDQDCHEEALRLAAQRGVRRADIYREILHRSLKESAAQQTALDALANTVPGPIENAEPQS